MNHYVYKYVLDGEIIYIGKTDVCLSTRLNQHGKAGDNIPEVAWDELNKSNIYYAILPDRRTTDFIETLLISRYKPKYNKAKKYNVDYLEGIGVTWEIYRDVRHEQQLSEYKNKLAECKNAYRKIKEELGYDFISVVEGKLHCNEFNEEINADKIMQNIIRNYDKRTITIKQLYAVLYAQLVSHKKAFHILEERIKVGNLSYEDVMFKHRVSDIMDDMEEFSNFATDFLLKTGYYYKSDDNERLIFLDSDTTLVSREITRTGYDIKDILKYKSPKIKKTKQRRSPIMAKIYDENFKFVKKVYFNSISDCSLITGIESIYISRSSDNNYDYYYIGRNSLHKTFTIPKFMRDYEDDDIMEDCKFYYHFSHLSFKQTIRNKTCKCKDCVFFSEIDRYGMCKNDINIIGRWKGIPSESLSRHKDEKSCRYGFERILSND